MALSHSFSSSMKNPRCHDDEISALLQFKGSFVHTNSCKVYLDDYPKVEKWKFPNRERGDCCLWDGVECDDQTGHVISLDLSNSCLFGSINSNSTLFSLVHLQRLNLANNDFDFSEIPSKIDKLSSLTYLNLSQSKFSGQIPPQLSNITTLVSLDLSGHSNLQLHRPSLKGLVQYLINLKQLHLSYVNISSSVDQFDFFANFSSLESLRLSACWLNGEFPMAIFNLSNLKILDISSNPLLRGYLPNFRLGSPHKSLELFRTSFGGEIPPSIENLVNLEVLRISDCNFRGKLPLSLGNLTRLISLSLSKNLFNPDSLTTSSLSWISKLTKLSALEIFSTNMKGEFPSWLMNLIYLSKLIMRHTQLTGPIPPGLNKVDNNFDRIHKWIGSRSYCWK